MLRALLILILTSNTTQPLPQTMSASSCPSTLLRTRPKCALLPPNVCRSSHTLACIACTSHSVFCALNGVLLFAILTRGRSFKSERPTPKLVDSAARDIEASTFTTNNSFACHRHSPQAGHCGCHNVVNRLDTCDRGGSDAHLPRARDSAGQVDGGAAGEGRVSALHAVATLPAQPRSPTQHT